MTGTLNPYESPGHHESPESWWEWMCGIFRSAQNSNARVFADGAKVIVDGIAFYVAPDDPALLFGASPSTENADERMNLVVAEAIRVLPIFLQRYPELHQVLTGRKMTVRLITSYDDSWSAFSRQQALQGDYVAQALCDEETDVT